MNTINDPHHLDCYQAGFAGCDYDVGSARQWGAAVLGVADFIGRAVRWPGSMGHYYVIEFAGFAVSGRAMWTCVAPSGNVINAMIPCDGLVHFAVTEPRAAQLYREQSEE